MSKLLKIHPDDNVAVALEDIEKGYSEDGVTALEAIPKAHKIVLSDIGAGDSIIKYGYPIGRVTADLTKGSYAHTNEIKTNLEGVIEYTFQGDNPYSPADTDRCFNGYVRSNGSVGIRNEIWIIPTVGCVNKTAQELERRAQSIIGDGCDGVFAFTHPYGCSQMGDDQENTRKILSALINHPNAAGVLVLSLGCENTNADVLRGYLGYLDDSRVKFLVAQQAEDEISEGLRLIEKIYNEIKNDKRTSVNIGRLVVGYKCGGSDAFSGITANMLCGRVNDMLTSAGAATILTEVPEMFGAEDILFSRAESREVFNSCVDMVNGYKRYFEEHNQECYENPSPGNHDGGITTLEEKSLGCVQKGGESVITDVLGYGERVRKNGLNLLYGPGNDIVSVTNLAAAGAQIILFTTGRGTSLGAVCPTIKISSNTALCNKKNNWIDFDAGRIVDGASPDALADELFDLIIRVANGEKTKNEINNYRDISIFKDGVIM